MKPGEWTIGDLSIMEERILKHLYCQNPHRNYTDPRERFRFDHGLELIPYQGMMIRLYLAGLRTGSDLYRRIEPGLCIQGGTLGFIHSQLKAPRMVPDTRTRMPELFKRAYHDAMHNLIHLGCLNGYIAGHEIAQGEDGFRAPVPAPWRPGDEEAVVGVSLTELGFATARELVLQLAEAQE